ncbi:hypothetical protein BRW64_21810 [Mycolicibacterium diernhoferi]|uniref:Uncharacterized protein n=1 Tax=Mycolicibacterium diernhoferi TaxID=1801 RepID=A0A1Q4H7I8_9MYCO|nr:hypothetical protein BRW64_21810 [Mycolicibacterium diernhoferi]OPE54464.1 hypothetical protein BV510_10140 [Mycolicibacterium diernhoferi]PEG55489.1 hypothetical protein CRI78_06145 [Mycolicibacterium diernhoferi]
MRDAWTYSVQGAGPSDEGPFAAEDQTRCGYGTVGGLLPEIVGGTGRVHCALDLVDSCANRIGELFVHADREVAPRFKDSGCPGAALPDELLYPLFGCEPAVCKSLLEPRGGQRVRLRRYVTGQGALSRRHHCVDTFLDLVCRYAVELHVLTRERLELLDLRGI